ncbi:hypothetical protein A2Z33_05130 [Candidatus Gottesmanbacteria bacterium RBG_16_52_11]|uniref:Phosphodiester glycosidase domain-containing protein n=1 Tax=Candidatus Gottesmanbacteria bacterium RBG_16_52_11 TaxID=1798374 RepID=A0A1F5YQN2_9BACT|nr:MAG: hypothetical protein A2Z33_05130 [Candidatus Gottesmanbacteria bacterium RBG_16_52_11]
MAETPGTEKTLKYLLLILIPVIFFFVIRFFSVSAPGVPPESAATAQPAVTEIPIPAGRVLAGTIWSFALAAAGRDADTILIPNFRQASSSARIRETYNCKILINGGFYTTDHKPLGYFAAGPDILSSPQSNQLINGYIWRSGDIHGIGSELPEDPVDWAFQTGPILLSQESRLPLIIRNDEPSRRSVAAVDNNGQLILLSVFGSTQMYSGPLLGELPGVIYDIGIQESRRFVSAVNLDGGSASAFVSRDASLSEISIVGSFICVR